MPPTLRAADEADVAAVLELWQTSGAEPSHTDDTGSLTGLIRHDPQALIVAVSEGRIVGTVIAGWDGWRGSIYRLVVEPTLRRGGLGRRLVRHAEECLAARGAVRLQAIVVESDARATAFWRAGDWTEQRERLRFVKG